MKKLFVFLILSFVSMVAFGATEAGNSTITAVDLTSIGGVLGSLLSFLSPNTVAFVIKILGWISAVVTAATAIVAFTPSPKDDSVLAAVRKWIGVFAGNVLFNK